MRRADRTFDWVGASLAVVFHGALLVGLAYAPPPAVRRRTVVEVDIRKTPPQVIAPPPERQLVKKAEKPPEAPKTRKPPTEPPKEPPKPVFGLKDTDLVGDGIAVPQGNTTLADPTKRPKGPVPELPPSQGVPAGAQWRPLAESDVSKLPDHNADDCFAGLKDKYSASDAYAEGIEGQVVFRIELDDRGKIRGMKKVKGIGHGIDEMAMGWLRFNPKCRFSPAIGKDGKPGGFAIERYTITFEIVR